MIISHKHKFIFIKTQKTAGTSLEIALSEICGSNDIITPITEKDEAYRKELGFLGPQNYLTPLSTYNKRDVFRLLIHRRRQAYFNHIGAKEIQQRVGKKVWDEYFKFSFERNPFDKVVSYFYWAGKREGYTSILDFLKSGAVSRMGGFNLYTIDSLPVVDKVYKYEEMSVALSDLSNRLKLSKELLLPVKRTKGNIREDKRHYSEILTEEEVYWIERIFAREIKYYDYSFEIR